MNRTERFMHGQVVRVCKRLGGGLLEGKECLVQSVIAYPPHKVCQVAGCAYYLYRPLYPPEHPNAIESRVLCAFEKDEKPQSEFFEHELVATGHFLDQMVNSGHCPKYPLTNTGRIIRVESMHKSVTSDALAEEAQEDLWEADVPQNEDHRLDLPLCVAVRNGDWTAIKQLMSEGADPMEISERGTCAIAEAIRKDADVSFLKYFISQGLDLNSQLDIPHNCLTLLAFATLNNYLASAKVLLDAGAEIESKALDIDNCLLVNLKHYWKTSPQAILLLLEYGASMVNTASHTTALSLAMYGRVVPKTISTLLQFGADPSYNAEWMQSFGRTKESTEYLELFLTSGIDVLQVDPAEGHSALMKAIIYENYPAFRRLLELGAMLNIESFSGADALYYAMLSKDDRFFNDLLAQNIDINYQNCWGSTPLMIAARNGFLEKAKRLLELGADLEFKDQWGATALMAAVRPGYKDMVEYLLSQDADHQIRNIEGETAYSYAVMYEHSEIAEMLLEHHKKQHPSKFKVGEDGWIVAPGGGPIRVDAISLDTLGCHYVYTVTSRDEEGDSAPSGWEYPRIFKALEYVIEPPETDE